MQFKLDRSLDISRPVLPEWTRWAWASLVDKQYWEPMIQNASTAWNRMEAETVIHGVRNAAFQMVPSDKLIDYTKWAFKNNLQVVPVTQMNTSSTYQSASRGYFNPSLPWQYRVLLHNDSLDHSDLIRNTEQLSDNTILGSALGYPKCCTEFFNETWAKGQIDTTWDQYATTGDPNGPVACNLLWRWLNIRLVFHLPCSYQCQASTLIGQKHADLMEKLGLGLELDTIYRVLNWKTSWSSINGIAEIVGPAVKISTRSDWAPPSKNRRFTRMGQTLIPWVYTQPKESDWKLNGFSSFLPMYNSHKPIVDAILEFAPKPSLVFDFGCGTGAMLRRARRLEKSLSIGGVDISTEAIELTRKQPGGSGNMWWFNKPIQEFNEADFGIINQYNSPKVFVYSPARLMEFTQEERETFIKLASKHSSVHVIYTYADNLQKKSLVDWALEAGLPLDKLLITTFDNPLVSVGVLKL